MNTLIVVGAFGFSTSVAFGAHSFVWDGDSTSVWTTALNWDLTGAGNYPGNHVGDDATIAGATGSNPVTLGLNLSNALVSLTISATSTADMGVQVNTQAQTQTDSFGIVSITGNGARSAYLDFNVSGSASSFTANALSGIDVERGASFTVSGAFTVAGDATFDLAAPGTSGTGQISVGSYVQNGGTNGSTATVGANGQIVTN